MTSPDKERIKEAIEFLDTQSDNNPHLRKGLKIIRKALPVECDPKDGHILINLIRKKEAYKDIEREITDLNWIDGNNKIVRLRGNILKMAALVRILHIEGYFKEPNGKDVTLRLVKQAAMKRFGIKNFKEIYRMEKFHKYEPIVRKKVTCLIPQNRPSYQRKLRNKNQ